MSFYENMLIFDDKHKKGTAFFVKYDCTNKI